MKKYLMIIIVFTLVASLFSACGNEITGSSNLEKEQTEVVSENTISKFEGVSDDVYLEGLALIEAFYGYAYRSKVSDSFVGFLKDKSFNLTELPNIILNTPLATESIEKIRNLNSISELSNDEMLFQESIVVFWAMIYDDCFVSVQSNMFSVFDLMTLMEKIDDKTLDQEIEIAYQILVGENTSALENIVKLKRFTVAQNIGIAYTSIDEKSVAIADDDFFISEFEEALAERNFIKAELLIQQMSEYELKISNEHLSATFLKTLDEYIENDLINLATYKLISTDYVEQHAAAKRIVEQLSIVETSENSGSLQILQFLEIYDGYTEYAPFLEAESSTEHNTLATSYQVFGNIDINTIKTPEFSEKLNSMADELEQISFEKYGIEKLENIRKNLVKAYRDLSYSILNNDANLYKSSIAAIQAEIVNDSAFLIEVQEILSSIQSDVKNYNK